MPLRSSGHLSLRAAIDAEGVAEGVAEQAMQGIRMSNGSKTACPFELHDTSKA